MKNAFLLRDNGDNRAQVILINLRETLDGAPDTPLEPYDVVVVPMSGIAKVNKAVDQYVRQMIPISLNVGFTYLLGGVLF